MTVQAHSTFGMVMGYCKKYVPTGLETVVGLECRYTGPEFDLYLPDLSCIFLFDALEISMSAILLSWTNFVQNFSAVQMI